MKLKGIFGKGSGKLGNAVFAVSGGEQLVKEYNPRVSNPNTPAQIEQRAKFKLLSQLAAIFAPAMAFRKIGLVSARNQFVKKNIGNTTYAENKANFILSKIKLTNGIEVCPIVEVDDSQQSELGVALRNAAPSNIAGMVYISVSPVGDTKLTLDDVKIVTEAGAGNTYPGTLKKKSELTSVFAYGIIAKDGVDGVDYYEMTPDLTGQEVSVAIGKLLKDASFAFTDTRFCDY